MSKYILYLGISKSSFILILNISIQNIILLISLYLHKILFNKPFCLLKSLVYIKSSLYKIFLIYEDLYTF